MKVCKKCVLPDTYPDISFDLDGVCNFCNNYKNEEEYEKYCISEDEILSFIDKYRNKGKWDAVVALSGGVDSSAALIDLVEKYKIKPLGFHNDHGYEDPIATENVRKLCKSLNIDLIIMQHDYSFMKKLWKFIYDFHIPNLSPCYICGNIIYANVLQIAERFEIPIIFNGYSKGQASKVQNQTNRETLLNFIIELEKIKHHDNFRKELLSKLETNRKGIFFNGADDLKTTIERGRTITIPFYALSNEHKTDKSELKKKCLAKFDWKEQNTISYPNRTSNCKIVWLSCYSEIKRHKYTAYHDEYSTLIRKGEMDREQALKDLKFDPPEGLIELLKKDVGIH